MLTVEVGRKEQQGRPGKCWQCDSNEEMRESGLVEEDLCNGRTKWLLGIGRRTTLSSVVCIAIYLLYKFLQHTQIWVNARLENYH